MTPHESRRSAREALAALPVEKLVDALVLTNARERRWRRRFVGAAALLLVVSGAAVAAVSTTTNTFSGLFGTVYTYSESTFTTVDKGHGVTAIAAGAAGASSGTAIEMALVLGTANTALTSGNWFYSVEVKEASVASVTANTFKAELFVDGTSKGALFMVQGTSDAANVEGVTFKWDVGSSLTANAAYVVKVSQV